MPVFVEILDVKLLHKLNEIKINHAFNNNKISKKQADDLLLNNERWYQICNHKGLLYIEDGRYYFITRTSVDYPLILPNMSKDFFYGKLNQRAHILAFNEKFKIVNKKWVLGDIANDKIKYRDLESRPEVIAKLVGSNDDLNKLKNWVQTLDLQKYDISDFFDINRVIYEFAVINLSKKIVKDE